MSSLELSTTNKSPPVSHNQNTSLNSLLANSKLLVKWHKNKAIDIEAEGYMDHIEMTVDHMKYSNEC